MPDLQEAVQQTNFFFVEKTMTPMGKPLLMQLVRQTLHIICLNFACNSNYDVNYPIQQLTAI
jgi:hypothetical protein